MFWNHQLDYHPKQWNNAMKGKPRKQTIELKLFDLPQIGSHFMTPW